MKQNIISNAELVWKNCLKIIKDNVNIQSYRTWFEPINPVKIENNVLTIQVPSQFFYEWLEEHYVSLLRRTIKREMGNDARLEYRIVIENSSGNHPHAIVIPTYGAGQIQSQELNTPFTIGSNIKNPFVIPGLKKLKIDSNLNPAFTFDTFVEGDCNQLARSAGYAVANKPGGTAFNPLVIYGGVGLGKTHLAQAIGNQIKLNFPEKTVLYVASDKFIHQFIDSLQNNGTSDFMHFYHLIDVLIMDDIHFFAGKEKTQEIFFNIFNHLHHSNKQLILTSDKNPRDLEGMEDRLLSRFKWGLATDLQLPDFETRVAILQKKAYQEGMTISADVIEYIAYNINTNIRELEGALISLLAQSSLNKKDIDLELAKKIIKNFVKNISKEISIDTIQKIVCEYFELPHEKLKEKTRKREIVQARQLSMYFAKMYTKNSLKQIGKYFGGKDHSTVIHSCQTVKDLMDVDDTFKIYVSDIQKKIKLNAP